VNRSILKLIVLVLIALGLTSCAVKKQVTKYTPLPKRVLTAMGYGTVDESRYVASQRRLMGMRASKMEAYRALAEQLYGVRLNSNTTVENMVVKNDSYRSYIDAVVRGARVKRITAIDANTYETVMEVELAPNFFECLAGSEAAVNRCLNSIQGVPMTNREPTLEPFTDIPKSVACNSDHCYSYPHIKGFTASSVRPQYTSQMVPTTARQFSHPGTLAMAGYR